MASTPELPALARLLDTAERMSHAAVWAGGTITLLSVFLIAVDVLVRKIFAFTLGGADELSSYAFAISTSWALAFATLQRANIRVDAIYQHLPVRVAAVLDWVSVVALGIFMVFLTRYAFDVAQTSWARGSTANTALATPLWIPQGLWLLGLLWMCLVLALVLTRASIALVTGDIPALKALCGVRTTQEEAEEEAIAGERMVKGEAQ